jgi:hypothetical protein
MRATKNTKKLIKNAAIYSNPDVSQAILRDLLKEFPEGKTQEPALAQPNIRRTIMKVSIAKLITAAAIVAVCIGIYYIAKDHHSGLAFGEVVKAMQQTRTATWTEVYEFFPPDDENVYVDDLGHVAQCAYKAPGRWRLDMTREHIAGGWIRGENKRIEERKCIQIWDFNAGKGLVMDPEKMTASPCSYEPEPARDSLFHTFLSPKADIPADAEPLGTKQIGGREAVGFRIRLKRDATDFLMGDVSEIWVDAKTKRLVLAETRDAERRWVSTLKDFIFDQDLDDSLFSVAPPEGYKDIGPVKFMWLEPSKNN